jgi:hypothetical protein
LWIKVSSKSSTRQYLLSLSSTGGKKGGTTFGKLVKLFGKVVFVVLAMADAFNMANGFFPVKVVWPRVLPFA